MSVVLVVALVGTSNGEPVAKEIFYTKQTALLYPATHTFRFSLRESLSGVLIPFLRGTSF